MKPPYSPNVQNQTVSYGGQTWKGNPGSDWSLEGGGNSGGGNVDVVGNAQKLLDFQKTANAPVVASLQSQTPGIQDKYKQLVDSIKGNQQVSTNRQTLVTNNELGKRGILNTSGLYGQEMSNSLTPIEAQYAGLTANANAGSIQDLQDLALHIAQLQAGNPETAIQGGIQAGGIQQGANQFAQNLALQQAQFEAQKPYLASQTNYQNALANSLGGGNMTGLNKLRLSLGM